MAKRALYVGWVLLAVGAAACSAANGEIASTEDVGEATVAITSVPSDVGCIAITAQGTRTVQEQKDVTSGQSSVIALRGLPLGAVSFSAQAYSTACSAVTTTSTAVWVGNSVVSSLTAGTVAAVSLSMRRNGQASVSVDFIDTTCQPTTCATANVTCGPLRDGCGGTLQCGNCSSGQTCESGACQACVPSTTCAPLAPSTGDAHADCAARINQFRACNCLPALQRNPAAEACADAQTAYDYSHSAHQGFADRICQFD